MEITVLTLHISRQKVFTDHLGILNFLCKVPIVCTVPFYCGGGGAWGGEGELNLRPNFQKEKGGA